MNQSRRTFIKQGTVTAGVLALAPSQNVLGANEKFVLGVIGPGGMGTNLLNSFVTQSDVSIAYVCDVDEKRTAAAALIVQKAGGSAKQVNDMRRIFEDKSVDAVIIATPDHWHAPATILACDAGKHVYVEKPCSHNIREGRLMIEASRRNNRVVQVGTQSRSAEHIIRAMQLLRDGVIGEVLAAKAWNSQLRANIGHVKPSEPPSHLDFDLWLGPAPKVPYRSNLLHASWRWFHAFGAGDIGNDGIHDIDIARWGLGVETHPHTISAIGGKYFFDDDQQFPDTQYIVYDYGDGKSSRKKQLIYEQRIWSPYFQEGYENGNAFYGTNGMMLLGKAGGWKITLRGNKPGEEFSGKINGLPHHRNFLECIKSGKRPNADIEINHLSTSLSHFGNLASRLGRTLTFDPNSEKFLHDPGANKLLRREYRKGHWAVPKAV